MKAKVRRRVATGVAVFCASAGTALLGPSASAAALPLPDGREYELVSPTQKFGYPVGGNVIPTTEVATSSSGDRVTYGGLYPLPGSESSSYAGLVTQRSDTGWAAASWLPAPQENQVGLGIPGADAVLRGQTPEQTAAVYYDNTTTPYGSLWIARADGSRQQIAMASSVLFGQTLGGGPGQPWFEGMSDDGRHVVFADSDVLRADVAPSSGPSCERFVIGAGLVDQCDLLYEWIDDGANGGTGTLRPIARIDGASSELGGSAPQWSNPALPAQAYGLRHAISKDGSRIFFQSPAATELFNAMPQGGGPVFVTINGGNPIEASAPVPGYTPASPATSFQYLDASRDGTILYFWANGDLAQGAPGEGGIYRFDVDAHQLEFLTTTSGTPTAIASDDGSHLYYEDPSGLSVLTEGTKRLITSTTQVVGIDTLPGLHSDRCPTVNVSPDGRYLVFSARKSGSNIQVYRYDAATDSLDRLSTSANDPGGSDAWLQGGACQGVPTDFQVRIMSDDGQYVFFDTSAPLVPEDTNGTDDSYEWHAGKVFLISSGTSQYGSRFAATDATGKNAFFMTRDALVPQDGDTVWDIYDARIGGGFAFSPRTSCEGEGCRTAPTNRPAETDASSAAVNGSDNVPALARIRFTSLRISSKQKRRLAQTGTLRLRIRTSAAGTITARLTARTGRRMLSVDRAERRARGAGDVVLTLRLSRRALSTLHRGMFLRIRIELRHSRVRAAKQVSFVLGAPREAR